MGLFKKKNKKERELDKSFERVSAELNRIDSYNDPKKLERYILDSCEEIISATKDIMAQKEEMKKAEAYLSDIEKLSMLDEESAKEIKEASMNIVEIKKMKRAYKQLSYNITDEQIAVMEREEEEIPNTILRMQENEKYQAKVKREMNELEGEKNLWEIERREIKHVQKKLRIFSILLLVLFASMLILSFVLENMAHVDVSWLRIITYAIAGIGAALIFLYMSNSSRDYRSATKKMNKIIEILNLSRMKYANITKAIDYVREKYKVENSYELNYVWEQYTDAVRERARYEKNSDDLEYFMGRLYRLLKKLDLYDTKVWMLQVKCLVDPIEMQDLKHKIIERRKKIKIRMEENKKAVKSERDEIDKLMDEHHYYVPEILEIIERVDKIISVAK